jgi:hypothetical protein
MAKKTLNFGPLVIEYDSPVGTPVGVPMEGEQLDVEASFVTLCPVTYRREGEIGTVTVDAGFAFDGASIPRELWVLPGFAPSGRKLWAAMCHDWLCVQAAAGKCDRVMADAWFDAVLEHTGVDGEHRTLFELAVNAYRWFCRYMKWRRERKAAKS